MIQMGTDRKQWCLPLLVLTSINAYVFGSANIKLNISPDGEFSIATQNQVWLKSSGIWFNSAGQKCSNEDGTLSIVLWKADSGHDNLGSWNSEIIQLRCTRISQQQFQIIFKSYQDIPVLAFGQVYLQDTDDTSSGSVQKVSSSFPSFEIPSSNSSCSNGDDLGYYTINGYMAGDDSKSFGRWNTDGFKETDGQHMGPLSLFNAQGPVLIISPFVNFMASSIWHDATSNSLRYGFLGKASNIPRGSEVWTMVHYSEEGVNKGFYSWGTVMKTFYQSQNEIFAQSDFTLNYLGYWTDNGAFYYYNTEKNKTYEQTVFDIAAYAKSLKIPYQYIQYDSWFYPKGPGKGILEWIPSNTNFPDGLQYIQNLTGWPVAAHSKWWSPKSPLAKQNGGHYDFIIEKHMALPVDQKIWFDIIKAARQWNLLMYEQDWLGQMFDGLSVLQTNVTIGRQWMLQMAEGVKQNGVVMQQCTAYPRHTLMALEIPVMTQQRVTMDYALKDTNWRTGVNSLWVHALGQTPFKDIFWTTPVQHCPKYPKAEHPYVELDSLSASLTGGPIAPSDGINMTNRELLMRCCNEDGLIIKPDKPATAIDSQFYKKAFGASYNGPEGEVWTTHSRISGLFFGIIFSADSNNSFSISSDIAGFPKSFPKSYAYTRDNQVLPFGSGAEIEFKNCTKSNFCLYFTSPILQLRGSEVVLMGELSKWIPISKNRVLSIEQSKLDLRVTIQGSIGENVSFWIKYTTSTVRVDCLISKNRRAVISLAMKTCKS